MKFMYTVFLTLLCAGITSNIVGMQPKKKPLPSNPTANEFIETTFLGDKEKVKEFLDKNISPNTYQEYNHLSGLLKEAIVPIIGGLNAFSTAIVRYAAKSDIDNKALVELFLNSNKVTINAQSSTGFTALMIATILKSIDAVKLLLEHGANPNIQNKDGNTALHLATITNYNEIAPILINYGAKIDIANNDSETPTYLAAAKENKELEKIFDTTEKLMNLVQAAHEGKNIEKEYLTTDIDVNAYISPILIDATSTNQDINALSAAAINGHSITVSQLINTYGANINAQNKEGFTALMLIPLSAANVTEENLKFNLFQTFEFLLKNHADIEKKTVDDETVVYAILSIPFETGKQYLEELLKYKPNLALKDKHGQTPLDFAQSSEERKKYIDILKKAEKYTALSEDSLIKNLSSLTNSLSALSAKLR